MSGILALPLVTLLATPGGGHSKPSLGELLTQDGNQLICDETGTTGRRSNYHSLGFDDEEFYWLPELDEERVRYSGSTTPSRGHEFDEGALAYRIEGDNLILSVACAIDPRTWIEFDGDLFGQGDLFLAVDQGEELLHYALLNEMPERHLGHRGRWKRAQQFRFNGDAMPGELVLLSEDAHFVHSGGRESFTPDWNSPKGLDERVFACDGEAFGVGELSHSTIDAPQPLTEECVEWTVSEWTVPLDAFAEPHQAVKIGLHIATTCGNDQIEGVIEIPARTQPPKTRDRIN